MRAIIGLFILALAFGLLPHTATAKHYLRHQDRSAAIGKVPACDDSRVLSKIARRFAWAEYHTWGTNWTIDRINQPRLRYNNFNGPSSIAHRHCRATAVVSNGKRRTIFYRIEDRMGFASFGWNVSFCVSGLDRQRVYGANCQSLK